MLVIAISTLGYLLLAITFIIDKYILSSAKQPPVVYTVYSTVSLLIVLLAIPFGVTVLPALGLWWWSAISGITFAFALWVMFVALEHGEATHILPFIGVWIVLATVILSRFLLEEQLTMMQQLGVLVLVFSAILLSFERTRKKKPGFHIWYAWALLSGVLYGVSHVAAKIVYDVVPFVTGFFWTRLFIVPLGLMLFFNPCVHRKFNRDRKKSAALRTIWLVIASKVLAALAVVLIQYAISLGSVSIVQALAGVHYTILFVLVFLLTKFAPKIFKEFFTKKEILIQIVALILVFIGLYLFTV